MFARAGASPLTLLILAVTLTGGGVGAAYHAGMIEVPEVSMADVGSWGDVTDKHVEIVTTVDVDNPNSFAIDLQPVGVGYRVYMNDVLMARGSKQGERIPQGSSSIDVTTQLIQTNIPDWWVAHMENDEVTTVRAEAAVDLETPVYSHTFEGIEYTHEITTDFIPIMEQAVSGLEGSYEYSATGIDIVDPEIRIEDTGAAWGDITQDTTELRVTLHVNNPNAYPLPVPEFVGKLVMNGVTVAEWQANDVDVVNAPENGLILPQETEEITLSIDLQHEAITDWLTAHIDQHEYTQGTMQSRMAFTLEGETFYLPPQGALHCRFQFWTGILEDQQQRMQDRGCQFRDVSLRPDSGKTDSTTQQDGTNGNSEDETDTDENTGSSGLTDSLGDALS